MHKEVLPNALRAALVLVVMWFSATTACAQTSAAAEEARFLAAREAARTGDRATLESLASRPGQHPLDGYIHYWLLSNRLAGTEPPPTQELNQFLSDEAGSLLAERLRGDWLRRLAKDGEWGSFLQIYPDQQDPEVELRCLNWNARLMRGDSKVLDEVANRWASLTTVHAACTPALRAAMNARAVSTEDVWRLFRRQVDTRSPANARATLAWLDDKRLKTFDQILRKPKRYLDSLPSSFASSRSGRELALAAVIRLAREDVSAAHTRLQRLSKRLNESERSHGWGVLALRAAQEQRPEAAAWFRSAGNAPLTTDQRAWRIRVALRAGDWSAVLAAIDRLPADERAQPEWVYWRGRALSARNQTARAEEEFSRIANTPNFYGILASEELGLHFDPLTTPPSVEAEDNVDDHPGFQRALALFQLDLRQEGVREWNWALRGRDEAFRLAAARLALRHEIYDRAITSAELANPVGAWDLRYITPFRELIEPHTLSKNLDMSWVYGLIRQESRFIVPARSSSGAQGLMQIMPATGKYVAKRLGMSYHLGLLQNPETNVELGTEYMRIVLDELGNDAVLASAGYNAGPSRALRWRASRPLEGAVYAETIPLDETRDYVKKVMVNTVIYAALLEGQPQSLKARLGTIPSRSD
jgi:soluble lytic murein transglycosylase